MTTKEKSSFEEVENLLQEIGHKIEELITKGAEVSGEAKVEVEKKVKELKKDKASLEKEFNNRRQELEEKYASQKKTIQPMLEKSKEHFKAGLKELSTAIKTLFD
ncbi:hypothetical protein [Echinicola salinicaeni]|uniref:hypothetical protein n=1 Tax=Echinicola salinicaeni TaxID=2762757 RepID=UPI0016483762|nr:hypothetical protein [Echinicola salinicaeni]